MDTFTPGLDLNERFYHEIVRPILSRAFPELGLSAARLGSGSEVLGYDDHMSTDHDWGPAFQLFLPDEQFNEYAGTVDDTLRRELPTTFLSYPTNFTPPNQEGTRLPAMIAGGPANHRIEITTVTRFFQEHLAYDVTTEPTVTDWLAWPQQKLLGATKGRVFEDSSGALGTVRQRLLYYPQDVWLYMLACQWARIGQEEHLVGRAAYVEDELGSRVMAARLVHDMMLLGFLMEKRYASYPKWFGTAFSELACAPSLVSLFQTVLSAEDWHVREAALCTAYEAMAQQHNALGITEPLDTTVRRFYDRPFRVIAAERFTVAIKGAIADPQVMAVLEAAGDIGSIDQYSHSTDLRSNRELQTKLRGLYQ